ncbi:MAG: glycine-rich domain-containing protein [Nitrospirota bacterium]
MILDAITKKLEIILAGAVTANQLPFQCDWVDVTTTASTPGTNGGLTNSAVAVDLVPVPGGTTQRIVKYINIYNADTAAATVTVRFNDNSTLRTLVKIVLQVGETIIYNGTEFLVLDATGSKKLAQSGTGRWLRTVVLTAGSSHVTGPQATSIFVRMVGGGGGGGGCSYAASNFAFGGGGASGAYAEKTFTVTPNTAYTYAIGGAGAAGANTAGTGGTGGDSTFAVGGVTVTAKGGLGGVGMATGATLIFARGGAGVIATLGDVNGRGMAGRPGIRHSGLLGCSGNGGSNPLGGGGGNGSNAHAVGAAGLGYGAGGGGGAAMTAAVLGGAGTAGCIIVDEFA